MREAGALLVLLMAAFMLVASPDYYPGDDRYYLNVAWSLVEHHSVALEAPGSTTSYDPNFATRGPDGRIYSKYLLGHPVWLAPFYATARAAKPYLPAAAHDLVQKLLLSTATSLSIALSVLLAYGIAHRLGYGAVAAFFALGIAFGTSLWPATKPLLSEPTQALFLTLLGYALIADVTHPRPRWCALAGFAAAWLVQTKLTELSILIVAPLAILYSPKDRWARLAAFALPAAAGVVLMLIYNHVRSGALIFTGYNAGSELSYATENPVWAGLYGLLLSPGKGLFYYSPPLLLIFFGLKAFCRRHPLPALIIGGLIIAHILGSAIWTGWAGDWAWGCRYMVTIHPLLGVLALPALERALAQVRGRRAIAAFLGVGIFVQILGFTLDPFAYIQTVRMKMPLFSGGDDLLRTKPGAPFITDSLIYPHYVPAFSPLLAHTWLLSRMIAGVHPRDEPWRYLQADALTPPADLVPPVDIWWVALGHPAPGDPEAVLGFIVLCVLLMGALGAGFWLRRNLVLPTLAAAPDIPPVDPDPAIPEQYPSIWWISALIILATLPASSASATRWEALWLLAQCAMALLAARSIARAARHCGVGAGGTRRLEAATLFATMLWARLREPGPWGAAILAAALITERAAAGRRTDRGILRGLLWALLLGGTTAALEYPRRSSPAVPPLMGLFTLLLSSGKGLFAYNPVLLLALFPGGRRRPTGPLLILASIPVLVVAALSSWPRDTGWGPGGLILSLPPLLVLSGFALDRWRWPTRVLLALSIGLATTSILVRPMAYLQTLSMTQGFLPPGPPILARILPDPLTGTTYVPHISPIPGQIWMTRLALTRTAPAASRPPYAALFWRGYAPRQTTPPPVDLWWIPR